MIQVTDDNKVIIEGEDTVAEATRVSILLLELTKKLNAKSPKVALSFLRVVHTMCNGLAKPIVDKLDEEAEKKLKGTMAKKKAEKQRRRALVTEKEKKERERLNGDTEQSDTTSGNTGEHNSTEGNESAAE